MKPWTCLLSLLDVYFVLPFIDRVERIFLLEVPKLQLGPQPLILSLRDGVRVRLFWCIRLLSTTNFPGTLNESPRNIVLTELVEGTIKKFSSGFTSEAFCTIDTAKGLVQAVANRLEAVFLQPPFPPKGIHNFDFQVGRLVLDSLSRNQYFEATIQSPIMAVNEKPISWET